MTNLEILLSVGVISAMLYLFFTRNKFTLKSQESIQQKALVDFMVEYIHFEQRIHPLINRSILPLKVFFEAFIRLHEFIQKHDCYSDLRVQGDISRFLYNSKRRFNQVLIQNLASHPVNDSHTELLYLLEKERSFMEMNDDLSLWFFKLFHLDQLFFDRLVEKVGIRDISLVQHKRKFERYPDEVFIGQKIYSIIMMDERVKNAFIKNFEKNKISDPAYRILAVTAFRYLDFNKVLDVESVPEVQNIHRFLKKELKIDFKWFQEVTNQYFKTLLKKRHILFKGIDISALQEKNFISQPQAKIVISLVHSLPRELQLPHCYAGYEINYNKKQVEMA